MTKFYYLSVCFSLFSLLTLGQGKLILVGGGSEEGGGWSDKPYQWAIDNSTNKKVAVISYDDQDNFIPDYFLSLGANSANNIKIDTHEFADLQSTYDSLMKYDVFFIKGGDQFVYYSLYKSTRTAQAIADKFANGEVIAGTSAGMAILSSVLFTAANGSSYPYDCLKNYKHSSITLADDFLPFFNGFVFDTHFTERGRIARLISFMAKWHDITGEYLIGVGVDDRTSLCINENSIGKVFGTGTVSFISCNSFGSADGKELTADSINNTQLLYGHSFDFTTLKVIDGPTNTIEPSIPDEKGNYQLMLSGGEGISANTDFMDDFIHQGKLTDTVVLITFPGKGKDYIQKLNDASIPCVVLETSTENNEPDQIALRNAIRSSKKILFAENNDMALFSFFKNGPTGKLLEGHCKRNRLIVAFVGQDSRYAARDFVTNHITDEYAAYYGRLQFKKGLGLLKTSAVMPDAYNPNGMDFYENTTAAVPYTILSDSLKFGFYINRNTYLKFSQEASKNYFSFVGDLTGIAIVNNGTAMQSASQPVNAAGDFRNYVGFVDLKYACLSGDKRLFAGFVNASIDLPYTYETTVEIESRREDFVKVFPNPSTNGIFNLIIDQQNYSCVITVHDILGRLILSKPVSVGETSIDLSMLPNSVYLLRFESPGLRRVVKLINQ